MASNTDIEYYKSLFQSPVDAVIDVLEMLILVDIGIIQNIDANGRASVLTTKISNGVPFVLTDIEVIGIGNQHGAFTVDGGGCTCLLFAPRTNIPDLKSTDIDITTPAFSNVGVKALPISNGRDLTVNACFNAEGTLTISTDKYQLCFAEDSVRYTSKGLCIKIDENNTLYLYRRNTDSGTFSLTLDDEGVVTEFTNKDNTSKYTFTLSDDGLLEISHIKPGTEEDTELNRIAIDKDGALSLSVADKFTISIDKDGILQFETEGDIIISSKGDISMSAEGDLSLAANGGINIDSGSDPVSINGNNLKVEPSGGSTNG